jgi:hypothetical protein
MISRPLQRFNKLWCAFYANKTQKYPGEKTFTDAPRHSLHFYRGLRSIAHNDKKW